MAAMLDDVTTPSSATTHYVYIILYNTLESVYQSKNLLEIMWTQGKLKGSQPTPPPLLVPQWGN